MQGTLISVWGETWREIWSPLLQNEEYGGDLLSDIYRTLVPRPEPPIGPEPDTLTYDEDGEVSGGSIAVIESFRTAYAQYDTQRQRYEEYITGTRDLRGEIRNFLRTAIQTEAAACQLLKIVFKIIRDIGNRDFKNRYYELIESFLTKYNLRYDLRRQFHLCPTLPGIFTTLVAELKTFTSTDDHLAEIMDEFEDAVRDLKLGQSATRIKSVIQKQINLAEAIGCMHPNTTKSNLGGICDDVATWPHDKIKDSMKALYGFTCNYPGIRHAGTPANRIRDIDIRDMIAVSVLITGYLPYLTDQFNPAKIYSGF